MIKLKKGAKCPEEGYLLTKEEYSETIRQKQTLQQLEELFK